MAYKLSELKVQIPGPAGVVQAEQVPPLSPQMQRSLNLQLDISEGYLSEPGTPRSQRAIEQLAIDEFNRAERARALGQTAIN